MTRADFDDLRATLGADPSSTALFFDFDGTLAPIVEDPASARAVDGAVELLDALAARFGRVAVVSGRPRSFLVERVGPSVDLSGLYGLETRVDGHLGDHPEAGRWREIVSSVVAGTASSAASPVGLPRGVTLEGKGLSLTVHYRSVPAAADAVHDWASGVAARTGLEVRPAKQSVELHPPLEVDKGTTVEAFAGDCSVVAYLGDDVGDLPAFAALDRLAERGVLTRKIAVASAELPAVVAQRCDAVIEGPEAVVELLGPLASPTGHRGEAAE